jgi:hypothetical protein
MFTVTVLYRNQLAPLPVGMLGLTGVEVADCVEVFAPVPSMYWKT